MGAKASSMWDRPTNYPVDEIHSTPSQLVRTEALGVPFQYVEACGDNDPLFQRVQCLALGSQLVISLKPATQWSTLATQG